MKTNHTDVVKSTNKICQKTKQNKKTQGLESFKDKILCTIKSTHQAYHPKGLFLNRQIQIGFLAIGS